MEIRLGVDVACRAAHQASCAAENGEMIWVGHRFRTDPDDLERLWACFPANAAQVTVVMDLPATRGSRWRPGSGDAARRW